MKKLTVLVIALVGMLTLGGVAANAGNGGNNRNEVKRVNSTVTLIYNQGPGAAGPYEEATFSGKVRAERGKGRTAKRKCMKRRTVVIKRRGAGPISFATVRTDKRGRYSVPADDAYTEPGQYRAKALKKRKIRANIKCEPAKSNEVTVPSS